MEFEGIVVMLTISTTIIGIIMASRFFYIDKQYSHFINEQKKIVSEQEEILQNNHIKINNTLYDKFGILKEYNRKIGFYDAYRKHNHLGFIIDFSILILFASITLFTTLPLYNTRLEILNIIVYLLLLLSLSHLGYHIFILQTNNEDTRLGSTHNESEY